MAATFKAEAAFIITGRGLVWTGSIHGGDVNTGDVILIDKDGEVRERKILGIGWGRAPGSEIFGLGIATIDDAEMQELRHWDIAGLEFHIESAG